jgi:protein SCO1
MRAQIACSLFAVLTLAACSRTPAPAQRTYTLQGQVLAIAPDRKEATIKNDEIKGFMMAMTMSYTMKDSQQLNGIAPGDLIKAKLVVEENGAVVSDVKKVGSVPLEQAPAATPSPASGSELLTPGELVPDGEFVDQNGKKRKFSSFKGSPLAVTFMYTSCPQPEFCPLMDRNFAAVQQTLKSEPALKNAHLVSISFDPANDTPAVLKKHASDLRADLTRWTFLTGDQKQIDTFASHFGMMITRAPADPSTITHNLETAIVDADGKLVKVYAGNDWKPEQLVADLKALT